MELGSTHLFSHLQTVLMELVSTHLFSHLQTVLTELASTPFLTGADCIKRAGVDTPFLTVADCVKRAGVDTPFLTVADCWRSWCRSHTLSYSSDCAYLAGIKPALNMVSEHLLPAPHPHLSLSPHIPPYFPLGP